MKILPVLVLLFVGYPFHSFAQEINIGTEQIRIGGTLAMPDEPLPDVLVIMISGSGAQNRDEDILGFRVFGVLAEQLADSGMASYRYDDRGVGGSAGVFSEASLDSLVLDVQRIMDHFESRDEHRFERFVLLGHSQGGVVSMKTAAEDERVSGVVLMASSMVPLKDVIDVQVVLAQKAAGKSDGAIDSLLQFQDQVYEAVRADSGWIELKDAYREILESELSRLPESARASITNMDLFTEAQFSRQVKPMRSAQMRTLLHYDPAVDLRSLEIPVLGVFGGKDTQVTLEQNQRVFEQVCEEAELNCQQAILPDANHLFQQANTGSFMEYGQLPKAFTDGFVEVIVRWVLEEI